MATDWKKEQSLRGQSASKQQRQASDPRCSVWVEASAGTGKTKVLSDRVLRLLLRGVPPAKILCLTYTKAAAVEMNDRIAKRLSEWAVISDEKLDEQLTKLEETLPLQQEKYQQLVSRARQLFAVLLDTPGGMKIQTLHSFCQEVLKRFPLEAKISPYFEVMDDRSKREILDRLRVQMLDEAEASDNYSLAQAVGYLAAHLGETSFPKMMNSITENAGKMQHLFENYDSLDALFDELARRLGVMPHETEDSLKQQWLGQLDVTCLQAMVRAWLSGSKKDIEKAELLSPLLERPFEINDYEVISGLFLKANGEPYAQYATKKALEIYPEFNAQAVRIAESLQNLDKHFAALRVFVSTKGINSSLSKL